MTSSLLFLSLFLLLSSSLLSCSVVLALDNGLARVPPMGWNSWNKFHCDVNETVIMTAAQKMVDLGLADVGYNYVNIDDCWMSPNRTVDGDYQADPITFPSGIKALSDHVHSLNLKFGIYTSAGTLTCAGFPASLGREEQDARTFSSWGVDYLKYDNCHNHGIPGIERYSKMRDALLKTGRPILFSLCQWGLEESWRWAPLVGNAWRTTGDIGPTWTSIKGNFLASQRHAAHFSGPGAWADPDMLEVGNGHLTLEEAKTHFALWALAKAPLILGMDLDNMSENILDIVKNKNLVAVNQDPNSKQALCFIGCGNLSDDNDGDLYATTRVTDWSAYATTVTGGDTVVIVVNWKDEELRGVVMAGQDVGVVPTRSQLVTITNLWTDEMVGEYDFESLMTISLPPMAPHGSVVYRFSLHKHHDYSLVS